MKNLKVFLVTFLIAVLFIMATTVAFATESNPVFVRDNGEEDNTVNNTTNDIYANNTVNNTTNDIYANNTVNNTVDNTATNNEVNNTVENTVNNTANENTSVYNNTDLPDAGSSDGIIIIATIVVFGISALYAYKKIREYNV